MPKTKPTAKPKSETWFSIGKHRTNIIAREFQGSTDSYLISISGRKTAKTTSWEWWYPDRESAVAALRDRLQRSVDSYEQSLKSAREDLAKFEKREGTPTPDPEQAQ